MKILLTSVVSCLLLPALCAAAPFPTQTETFDGVFDPALAQVDGFLVYGADLPSQYGGTFVTGGQNVFASEPADTPTVVGPVSVQVPVGATNMRGAVFSVYDVANDEVTLTLDSTLAPTIVGEDFSTVFTVSGYDDETTLAQDLVSAASGDSTSITYLKNFFTTYSSDFPSVTSSAASGTLVDFSAATLGGTATLTFTSVPEPSTWAFALAGCGILGLAAYRRRAVV